ncbi:MAG: hypothetical protein WHV67_10590 [Thermoanaerobaculia bacterium]
MFSLFFVFLGLLGQAGPFGPGCDFSGLGFGNFGQGYGFFSAQPWFLDDLDLPPEIMEKVQNLHIQHKGKMIDLQANLQKGILGFQQILQKPDLTEKEFLQEFDKISQMRDSLMKEKALFLFNLKKILPPDKWNILKDRFFEIRKGGKYGKKMGKDFDNDFPGRGPGNRR